MKKIKQLVTMIVLSSTVMTSPLSASAMVNNINPNIKSGDKVVKSIKEEVRKSINCMYFESIASKYIGEYLVTVMTNSTKDLIYMKTGNDIVNNAKLDQIVSVKLEENNSTGYTWNYEISEEGAAELISDNSIYLGAEGVCGAPSNHTFNFKMLKKGTTKITFNYYRSWEGKEKSIKSIEYKINVK